MNDKITKTKKYLHIFDKRFVCKCEYDQSTCILVVVATKSLRARRKRSDRREQKHLHACRENEIQKRSVELKYISVQRHRNKMIILKNNNRNYRKLF